MYTFCTHIGGVWSQQPHSLCVSENILIGTAQQASQKTKQNERLGLLTSYNDKKSSSASAVLFSENTPTILVEIMYK